MHVNSSFWVLKRILKSQIIFYSYQRNVIPGHDNKHLKNYKC
jgi:hypothetical protein